MFVKDPPVEITDSLVMLGTNEYPMYLVKGDGQSVLFEGGIGAMGPVVAQQVESLALDADSVATIVVTHAHPDHVMAVPMLREIFPNASLCASKIAAGVMSAEKAIGFFCKIDKALTGALLAAGSIDEAHQPQPLAEMKIPVDEVIADGETVGVAGASFTVIESPGHSDCGLSFHDPAAGVLIISDATPYYVTEEDFWWPCYFTSYRAYVGSMRRLASLDAEVLGLGHNTAVTGTADIRAFFDGAIAATEAYHRRIVEEIGSGRTPDELANQLGEETYARTQLLPVEFFQKNCALLVQQSMKHAGLSAGE